MQRVLLFMIAKQYRFKGQGGIKYLFRKGDTIRGNQCVARVLHNPRVSEYRAAVIVSKKVAKAAPKRNRIRRRIYESIRKHGPTYLKHTDIAIIVFSDTFTTMSSHELDATIKNILVQIQPHS